MSATPPREGIIRFLKKINRAVAKHLDVHAICDNYKTHKTKEVKALPDMIEKASKSRLKQAFNSHLGETENHISRLQEVFRMYDVEVKGVD